MSWNEQRFGNKRRLTNIDFGLALAVQPDDAGDEQFLNI